MINEMNLNDMATHSRWLQNVISLKHQQSMQSQHSPDFFYEAPEVTVLGHPVRTEVRDPPVQDRFQEKVDALVAITERGRDSSIEERLQEKVHSLKTMATKRKDRVVEQPSNKNTKVAEDRKDLTKRVGTPKKNAEVQNPSKKKKEDPMMNSRSVQKTALSANSKKATSGREDRKVPSSKEASLDVSNIRRISDSTKESVLKALTSQEPPATKKAVVKVQRQVGNARIIAPDPPLSSAMQAHDRVSEARCTPVDQALSSVQTVDESREAVLEVSVRTMKAGTQSSVGDANSPATITTYATVDSMCPVPDYSAVQPRLQTTVKPRKASQAMSPTPQPANIAVADERRVQPPETPVPDVQAKNAKKSRSWFRKANTTTEATKVKAEETTKQTGPKRSRSKSPRRKVRSQAEVVPKETSPRQMELWMEAVRGALREAQVAQSLLADQCQSTESEEYTKGSDYDDGESFQQDMLRNYSTFDDDTESVSSLFFLFNFLSCTETPTDQLRIDHRGKLVIATDSDCDDESWHENVQSRQQIQTVQE